MTDPRHTKRLTSHRVGEEIQVGERAIKIHRITSNRVFLRWRGDWERVSVSPSTEKAHDGQE